MPVGSPAVALLGTVVQDELAAGGPDELLEIDDDVEALRRCHQEVVAADRRRQQVAVIGDLDEGQVRQERAVAHQVEPHEARRAADQKAEAILSPLHPEERLDDAVDGVLVAEDAVEIERVEEQLPIGVERLVGEQQRHVELAARQAQAARLIAGVDIVEGAKEADLPLVDVLRRKVGPMRMVEQRAQRLVWVTVWRMRGGREAGLRHGVAVVAEFARRVEVPRSAVTLRRRMQIVQVRDHLVGAEGGIRRRAR